MKKQLINDYSTLDVSGSVELFLEKRIENDVSGNPIYVGYSKTPNESITEESWFILKLSYSGGYVVRSQLPDSGVGFKYAWNDRTIIFS